MQNISRTQTKTCILINIKHCILLETSANIQNLPLIIKLPRDLSLSPQMEEKTSLPQKEEFVESCGEDGSRVKLGCHSQPLRLTCLDVSARLPPPRSSWLPARHCCHTRFSSLPPHRDEKWMVDQKVLALFGTGKNNFMCSRLCKYNYIYYVPFSSLARPYTLFEVFKMNKPPWSFRTR